MAKGITPKLAVRLALGWLALSALQLGAWALFSPQSFYDDFPGMGRSGWISADGPFNEHLIRDFGALNLALAVLLIAAAVRLSRDLITVAAVASLVWGVPHLIYHIANSETLDGLDNVVSLGGLAVSAVLGIGLLVTARRFD